MRDSLRGLLSHLVNLFQTDVKEEESTIKEIEEERKFPSDDCFHLVAVKRWEDDIIWSAQDVKLNPLAEGIAGWIPSANIRTTLAYANQHTSGWLLNKFGLAKQKKTKYITGGVRLTDRKLA